MQGDRHFHDPEVRAVVATVNAQLLQERRPGLINQGVQLVISELLNVFR